MTKKEYNSPKILVAKVKLDAMIQAGSNEPITPDGHLGAKKSESPSFINYE